MHRVDVISVFLIPYALSLSLMPFVAPDFAHSKPESMFLLLCPFFSNDSFIEYPRSAWSKHAPCVCNLGISSYSLYLVIVNLSLTAFGRPDSTYSKPACINHRNLVLSCAQNFSAFNVLPYVRDKQNFLISDVLPNVRDEKKFLASTVLPNVRDNKKVFDFQSCVRDETSILESCLIPVFRCQGVRNHTCFHDTIPTVPPDTASFEQICLYSSFFSTKFEVCSVLLHTTSRIFCIFAT